MFVHYYLWWDANHWKAKTGAAYNAASNSALPAELDDDGCTATSQHAANQLIDVPALPLGLYSQDDAATFDQHIRDAADAGIAGFVVSWAGNGKAGQKPEATLYNRRLDILVQRVEAYNAAHDSKFYLMLGYQGLDNNRDARPLDWVINDLTFFATQYLSRAEFHIPAYESRAVVMLLNSRKFQVAEIGTIAGLFTPVQRSQLFLIGDERGVDEWNRGVAQYFDGDGWYWSSQNPYKNPRAFDAITRLGNLLHNQNKLWFSPLNGGYNKSGFDIGGQCTPRRDGETMQRVYRGNSASKPDGWMYISWNEFYENTYVEPSVRYGRFYLDALKKLIAER